MWVRDRCQRTPSTDAGATAPPPPDADRGRLRRPREQRLVPSADRPRSTPASSACSAALAHHLDRVHILVRRDLPHAPQPVESVGADLGGGHHGNRHGARHRLPQHRPVGGLDAGRRRHGDGASPGEVSARRIRHWHPAIWIIAIVAGLLLGALIGAFQGAIVAYVGVPSFIVTLGGLLVWRGVAWWMASGRTIAPMDKTFQLLGGGARGTIGGTWTWILGLAGCVGVVLLMWNRRRQRIRVGFTPRPMWAEITIGAIAIAVILGATAVINSYPMPERLGPAVRRRQRDCVAPRRDSPSPSAWQLRS